MTNQGKLLNKHILIDVYRRCSDPVFTIYELLLYELNRSYRQKEREKWKRKKKGKFFFMSPWFNPRGALFWPMLPNQGCQGSLSCMSSIL